MSESQLTPSYESPGGFDGGSHGYFGFMPEGNSPAPDTPDGSAPVKVKKPRKERIKLACDNCELRRGTALWQAGVLTASALYSIGSPAARSGNKSKHSCDGQLPCARCARTDKECTYVRPGIGSSKVGPGTLMASPDVYPSSTFSGFPGYPGTPASYQDPIVPYLNSKVRHLAAFISPQLPHMLPPQANPGPAERQAVRGLFAELVGLVPPNFKVVAELRNREVVSGNAASFPASFVHLPRDGRPATLSFDGVEVDGFPAFVFNEMQTAQYYAGCVWVGREVSRALQQQPIAQAQPLAHARLPSAHIAQPQPHGRQTSALEFMNQAVAATTPGARRPSQGSGTFPDASNRPPSLTIAPPSPDHAPELRKTFRLLVPVIDANDAAALIEDASGRCVSANSRFCTTFGIVGPPESLVGQQDCSARYVAIKTGDPFGFDQAAQAAIASRSTSSGDGYEFRLTDGRIFQRDYVAVFSAGESGEYAGHIWLFRVGTRSCGQKVARSLTILLGLQDVTLQKRISPSIGSSPQSQILEPPPRDRVPTPLQQQPATLVEDENRRVILTNRAFTNLFNIPVPPDALVGSDCSNAAQQAAPLFVDPEGFVSRIATLLKEQRAVQNEMIYMKSGKVLLRDYMPVWLDKAYLGHVWVYRPVV
jgi:hypothetical protein